MPPVLVLTWFSLLCAAILLAPLPAQEARSIRVARGFDGRSFTYTELGRGSRGELRLSFPSPRPSGHAPNDRVPAFLFLPAGRREGERRPAVVCLHILGGDFELTRMLCSLLADRGVGALWFPLPYYRERGGNLGRRRGWLAGPDRFCANLEQGLGDLRRAADLLAGRPEVDGERLGVAGISLGGIVAALGAQREERFRRVALALAGGDLLRILDGARECRDLRRWLAAMPPGKRREARRRIAGYDPLVGAAALLDRARAGRVLMICAGEDRVVPPACGRKLAAALDMEDEVIWLEGLGHYTAIAALDRVLGETARFFAADLPPGAPRIPAPPSPGNPAARVTLFLRGLHQLLFGEIGPGRCALVEVAGRVVVAGKEHRGTLSFARGAGGRFRLRCRVEGLGRAALGRGERLWLAAGEKALYLGRGGAGEGDLLGRLGGENRRRLEMLAGALAGITLSPRVLAQVVELAPGGAGEEDRVQVDAGREGKGFIRFQPGTGAPRLLAAEGRGWRARVRFRAWQPAGIAVKGFFAPPPERKEREVPAADLARMLAALADFALEKMQ